MTPTEQTVAGLVAEGLANGEIAARLYVSKRTVETHISRLYVKLQVDSRVAIANLGGATPVHKLGVDRIPECGTNEEVLRAHRLDSASVAERVEAALAARIS